MSEHKYVLLSDKLRDGIKNGTYPCDSKLPSENELVATTGYSRQTVRQAMSILRSEGLTERIRGSGTFVRSLKSRRERTYNIAVVTTYIGEYIFPVILNGIDSVLDDNGYTSMLSATRNRVDNERKVLTELLGKPIDGIIVEGTKTALPNPNIDLYEQFRNLGIPVVFINGFYPDLRKPVYVVADDRKGGYKACSYLLTKGHNKIAGIFKSDDIQGHRRYAGYVEALIENNITVNDDNVFWYVTENRFTLSTDEVLDCLKDCTAVVCYNDEVALQVQKILSDNADMLNGKVEIVSFDNSIYSQISAEPFLSLSNPKEALGRLAAQKMVNILDGIEETPSVMQWDTE